MHKQNILQNYRFKSIKSESKKYCNKRKIILSTQFKVEVFIKKLEKRDKNAK